jgi:hypothetical protein
MQRVTRIECPHCRAPLQSKRGIRIGGKTTCSKCRTSFTVRPDDARDADLAAGVNPRRAAIVVFALLLCLGGGAALGVYCWTSELHDDPSATIAAPPAGPVEPQPPAEQPLAPIPVPKVEPRAVSLADQRKIDKAIADGCWYLRDHVMPTGTWGESAGNAAAGVSVGFASLPALTLLECGVPPTEPVIQHAAALVRKQAEANGIGYSTYQRSLAILFLDRLGDKKDEALIQRLALSLIASLHPTEGAWSYDSPTLNSKLAPQLLKTLADRKKTIADFRKIAVGDQAPGGDWDHSDTQFAVLALWVAKRHHVDIDRPIALVEAHFRRTQLPTGPDPEGNNVDLGGSWAYGPGNNNSSKWPSMTCAGLIALAVAHGIEVDAKKKQKPLDDAAIKKGLDMLAREIERPNDARPVDYYFLWSLERAAVVYDLQKIGGKDWYLWGRQTLLPRQQEDGSWFNGAYYGSNPVIDTCFVLLFLKQANLAQDLTDKFELLGTSPDVGPARKE